MAINLKKYSADKVALFALLLLGFIIAQIIVSSRNGITLSEPMSLYRSGLSVQIPEGASWKDTGWIYGENSFNLISILAINSKPVASVQWQYLLTSAETEPAEQIRNRTLYYNGQILKTGQKDIGSVVMDWARIGSGGKIGAIFFGVARLGPYRTVTIEVTQKLGLGNLAKEIFDTVAESISFKENKPLEDGAKFISNFKDGRIADILYGKNTHRYFLINDNSGQTLGFVAEALAKTQDDDGQPVIGAVSMYNIDGPIGRNERSIFNGSIFLDTFHWINNETDTQSRTKIATEITLDQQGDVVVRTPVSAGRFTFGATMVPEALLEPILIDFLDSDTEQIILDLIISRGVIVPAFISKIDPKNNGELAEDIAYIVKIDFLDKEQNFQLMYFDNYKKLIRINIQGRANYNVGHTSKDAVLEKFPEWQEQILQVDASFR
jgi:hypothetical protein